MAIFEDLVRNINDFDSQPGFSIMKVLVEEKRVKLLQYALMKTHQNITELATGNQLEHYAAKESNVEILELLKNSGRLHNTENAFGWTPIMISSALGLEKNIGFFVENGFDKPKKQTDIIAMRQAIYKKDIQFLLNANFSVFNEVDFEGTLLSWHLIRLDLSEIIRSPKASNINWNLCNQEVNKTTPLILSILKRKEGMVPFLLEKGVDINKGDFFGGSPLLYAVDGNQESNVFLLLKKGANPNQTDDLGTSPLQMAVYNQNENLVKLLLEFGASAQIKNCLGETPYQLAVSLRNQKIIDLLN